MVLLKINKLDYERMKHGELLGQYQNGNYEVRIYEDGTKIRENDLDFLEADFPESMDCKITNRCPFGCPMCFPEETKILMSDYSYKNIKDINIGDEVFGFETLIIGNRNNSRIIPTKVLKTFEHVEEELLEIKTNNSKIICTPNHPIYTRQRRKNGRLFRRADKLNLGDEIFVLPFKDYDIDYNSDGYKLGYLIGGFTGDGSVTHSIDKNGYDMYKCRFVTLDDDINEYLYSVAHYFNNNFYKAKCNFANKYVKDNATVNASKSVYDFMLALYEDNLLVNEDINYQAGFLAGFYDSEGHIDQHSHTIRITNTNLKYIDEVKRCLKTFDIDFVEEEKSDVNTEHNKCYTVRILSDSNKDWVKFLFITRPKCHYKGLEYNYNKIKSYYLDKIIEINKITKMQKVYNFETSVHTYIANNILVHNCHEKSTPDGEHGDIMNAKFIDKLRAGTEIAIGGGAVTGHPDLIPFLRKLKERGVIPSITVHQNEFKGHYDLIQQLIDEKLIYGLGVSFSSFDDEFWNKVTKNKNVVVHLIAGIHGGDIFDYFADKGVKILILGYKDFGRGHDLLQRANGIIQVQLNWLKEHIKEYASKYKVVSFDNLAIEQLEIKNILTKNEWERFYQGDDGTHTMYVDLVKKQFARTSTSTKRYDLLDDIDDMFKVIKNENKSENKE